MSLAVSSRAADAQTDAAAGTQIRNVATISYVIAGQPGSRQARNVFTVDQLLDVTATWQNGNPVEAPAGASQRSLLFKITNQGNGNDDYALALEVTPDAAQGFTADDCQLYQDNDHSATWSSQDQPYPVTTTPPPLAAGASMDVLAVCNIPGNAPDQSLSHVRLDVTSRLLSGKPGASKVGTGHGAPILVVGMTGNQAMATGTYQAENVTYAFTSTQEVTDTSGGHVATSGSRITYTLIVTPKGTATGRDLIVTAPIPAHTAYVPDSLSLNGVLLGDSGSGANAHAFDAATDTLHVSLGDIGGSSSPQHIRFQVTIQ